MSDESRGLGAGRTMLVFSAIAGAVGVVFAWMVKRSLGIVLVILAVSYAFSQVKGDLVSAWQDWNRRAEAQELREHALQAEKLKLENELRSKQLDLERKKSQVREREAIITEKIVDQTIRENRVIEAFTEKVSRNWPHEL